MSIAMVEPGESRQVVGTVLQPPRSMRANFVWGLAGTASYALSQAGMLVVLTKMGTAQMVGYFALGLAIAAPVMLLANLQLTSIQTTDTERRFDFADYFGLRLVTVTLAALAVVLFVMLGGTAEESRGVVLGLILAKGIECLSEVFYGAFQARERMDLMAQSMIAKGILSIIALALGIWALDSLVLGVLLLAAGWAVVLLFFDLPKAIRLLTWRTAGSRFRWLAAVAPRWRMERLRALFLLALPLGIASMLDSLNSNLPRYWLQAEFGSEAVGYFSALAYIMVASGTAMNTLAYAARPRLARHFASNVGEFRSALTKLLLIAVGIGVAGIVVAAVAGEWLLSVLYTPDYAVHKNVFTCLMVAGAVWYITGVLSVSAVAAKQFVVQLPIYLAMLVVTAAACWLLTPRLGLMGAAWALVAGFLVRLVVLLLVVNRAVRCQYAIETDRAYA